MIKRVVILILTISLLFFCVNTVIARQISLATAGISGTYYPIGVGIAKAINDNVKSLQVTVETSGGSIANTKMIRNREIELAMGGSNTLYAGLVGDDPFDMVHEDLLGIVSLYPEVLQFVVLEESGLKTVDDLKGKRVVVGQPGSGTERSTKLVLEAHGITYNDIKPEYLVFGDAVTLLRDGHTDCITIVAGIPTAGIMEIATTTNINLLEVNKEKFTDFLEKETYFTDVVLPKGTYQGIDKEIYTGGTPALLFTGSDLLTEKEVYDILTAIFDNTDVIEESHALGSYIKIETALQGMSLPLHKGAEKYFKERAIF